MDSIAKDDERGELEPPILQGLAQAVPQVDPSPELRARVLNAATPRSASSPNRFVAWRLATAASLALAAGLAIYTSQLKSRITGLERELSDSRAQSAASRLLVADAQTAASRAQSAVAILSAPDVARVESRRATRVAQRIRPRILEPLARHGVQRVEPAAPSRRAHVSTVGGHRAGTDQRRPTDAGRARQLQRNVQHAAGHSATRCDGRHHRTGRRCALADRGEISRRHLIESPLRLSRYDSRSINQYPPAITIIMEHVDMTPACHIGATARQPDQRDYACRHRKLAGLDTDVEGQQCHRDLVSDRPSPSSISAPANPNPWISPNPKTTASGRRCRPRNRFSSPTHAIEAAMSGSTIDAGA